MAKLYNLPRGSNVLDEILKIAQSEGILTGSVIATGRVGDLTLSYYDDDSREYRDHMLDGNYEVVSLIGNITLKDGEPMLHAHGTFADKDLKVVGGHLVSATVLPVLEVVINPTENTVSRKFDENLQLTVIDRTTG
jgi:predicted DNA-binding protein with PD1-like motif